MLITALFIIVKKKREVKCLTHRSVVQLFHIYIMQSLKIMSLRNIW